MSETPNSGFIARSGIVINLTTNMSFYLSAYKDEIILRLVKDMP